MQSPKGGKRVCGAAAVMTVFGRAGSRQFANYLRDFSAKDSENSHSVQQSLNTGNSCSGNMVGIQSQ